MENPWGPAFVTEPTEAPEVPEIDEIADEEDGSEAVHQRTERERATQALRDLEAAKARVERDAKRIEDETRSRVVSELLPLLDNLDRTIAAARRAGDAPTVLDGVLLVRRQLEATLARFGVTRIDAVGRAFDPAIHEAVSLMAVRDPRHDRLVIEQLEPGYRAGERLLRPAKVIVGRAR